MDQEQIRQLVREMIESGRSAEDICRDHPDLVSDVRRQWQRVRAVEQQIDALFPSTDAQNDGTIAERSDCDLPRIPGYEVQGVLGRGGMGVVYRARHVSLNRTVAIKVPLAGAFATVAERQRHMREAQVVAALGHPNIITVHDVGEVQGKPYFTMEYIDGQHLGARLLSTPQPAREAASLVATLAEATDCAHRAGVIHRDLKPANVLVAPDGTPKITDFGLARQSDGDATLTAAGFQFGTPGYMAPEQAAGRPSAQSASVDIYSLGAILYEMLTGRPPFRGESAVETVRQVLEDEPTPPSRLNPRVPRDLETICLMCLRKEPQRRYSSASALAEDLRRVLRGEPIQARPVGFLERLYRWGRRRPAHAALVGAGVCALLASLGVGLWMQHIQNVRDTDASLREGRARQAIETAVSLTNDLRVNERWIEARHVLDDARSRVSEANSDELARQLDIADQILSAAWELNAIRKKYPDTNDRGYDYKPAIEAYQRIFARLGFGEHVPVPAAARAVDASPIREQLLIALDNSAFVSRAIGLVQNLDRPLAIARTADPDPWRDRFRQPLTWLDRDTLLALCEEAGSSEEHPPPHQFVIAGVLLSGLGANDKAIEILRNAHRLNPVDFWVNIELGNALVRGGRSGDATQYFRAAVTIQPKNPGPWATLGMHLHRSGSREEAIIAVRHATELNPRFLVAWRNYITYLLAEGRVDEANAAQGRAIEANSNDRASLDGLRMRLLWDRARETTARAEWEQALKQYKAMLPNGPSDAEFWFEVAAVSLITGDRDAFERTRDSMMSWNGPGTLRSFLVARTATLTPAPIEVVQAAAALSERELVLESTMFWAMRQQGAILCRKGCYADAVLVLEKSLASNLSSGRAVVSWLWLAIAYHHLGKSSDAEHWHATAVTWLDTVGDGMPDNSSDLGFHLHDLLEARLLRQEADLLLSGGTPTGNNLSP